MNETLVYINWSAEVFNSLISKKTSETNEWLVHTDSLGKIFANEWMTKSHVWKMLPKYGMTIHSSGPLQTWMAIHLQALEEWYDS